MNTYQICKHISYEYFVEAESFEEAQTKIINCDIKHESEDLIEWVFVDKHEGKDWINEPVGEKT